MSCLQPGTCMILSPSSGWLIAGRAHGRTADTHSSYSQGCPVYTRLSGLQHLASSARPAGDLRVSSPGGFPRRAATRAQHCLLAQPPAATVSRTVSSAVLANSLSSNWFWRSQLQFWEVLQNELLRGASLDQRVLTLLFMPDFQAKMIWNHPHSCSFFFFFSCNQIQNTQKEMCLSTRHR